MKPMSKQSIKNVKLSMIDEPKDVLRLDINIQAIDELALSIAQIGLLQPILVATDGDRYELVFGHRRFLACQKLKLLYIRAIVRTMTQDEIGIARATENINRADLTPVEEAHTYANLLNLYGLTLDQVSQKMGKSVGTIKRRMDLLKMPQQLRDAVHTKRISISVAEELWCIADQADLDYYLSFAIDGGCTRDVARSWAKEWKDKKRRQESASEQAPLDFSPMEPRPVYVSCDLCHGPMELGQEVVLRVCPECAATIQKNM